MLSENLFKLRKLHHLTQEQVANRLAVSRQAVAKWEAGETCPDLSNCVALARLYDVALDDLVHYREQETGLPLPPKGKHSFGAVTVGEDGAIVLPAKAPGAVSYPAWRQPDCAGGGGKWIGIDPNGAVGRVFSWNSGRRGAGRLQMILRHTIM